jgi:hypothetical protein
MNLTVSILPIVYAVFTLFADCVLFWFFRKIAGNASEEKVKLNKD